MKILLDKSKSKNTWGDIISLNRLLTALEKYRQVLNIFGPQCTYGQPTLTATLNQWIKYLSDIADTLYVESHYEKKLTKEFKLPFEEDYPAFLEAAEKR